MDSENIRIKEERITSEEYIDFLKRTDLGSQYPKERFTERIGENALVLYLHLRMG